MPEGSGALWSYLRDNILPHEIHTTRIESRTSPGFPDVHYTYHGVSGTLELKSLRKKKLPFGDDGLNREQLIWHRENQEAGGLNFIIAEVHSEIFVIPGRWYKFFNDATSLNHYARLTLVKRKVTEQDRIFLSYLLEKIYR